MSAGVSPTLRSRLGRHIGALRRERGLSQAQLGERLGIAQKNVHRLESGTQNMTLRTLERVAQALDIDVDALWAGAAEREKRWAPLWVHSSVAPRAVPIMSVAAAAGYAHSGQLVDVRGWALCDRAVDERHFVIKVEGDSMAPTIPSGAWCLFRRAVMPPSLGAVVLVEQDREPDFGRYLVKRLRFVGLVDERRRLVLESDNSSYPAVVLEGDSDDAFSVIAEWVEVIAAVEPAG